MSQGMKLSTAVQRRKGGEDGTVWVVVLIDSQWSGGLTFWGQMAATHYLNRLESSDSNLVGRLVGALQGAVGEDMTLFR